MDWDDRFNITDSKGNHETNGFYREYFDKSPKKTDRKHIKPRRNLVLTDPVDLRLPKKSKAFRRQSYDMEKSWDTNFHINYSKGNHTVHAWHREYFDTPKDSPMADARFSTMSSKMRNLSAQPKSPRETGLYGKNNSITDSKGNLRLRGAHKRRVHRENRWAPARTETVINNQVWHPLKRLYF